jgi:hypothetical protein
VVAGFGPEADAMTDAVHTAIAAQAAALAAITRTAGYQSDIGARLIWPLVPTDGEPTECLYRAGPIAFAQVRSEIVRVETTWAALVVAGPDDIDERALMVQSDMIRALRSLCTQPTLARLPIQAREPGSNTLVVAVSCTVGVPEPDPV